tara:strand:- start:58 stop:291 length:234 start_codon:yes stop_codon:yes gene_type:complete
MILDFLYMNGYGLFVWSAFIFTMLNFAILYFIISKNFEREKTKFFSKYALNLKNKVKHNAISRETKNTLNLAAKSKN